MPPPEWGSRAEMMRARRTALSALEREAWLDRRRPARGAVALALMLVGLVLGGAVIAVADYGNPGDVAIMGGILVPSVAAVVSGGWLGVRVWREGRRVVDALVAWEELTDRVPADGSQVPFDDREMQDATTADERRDISRRNWVYFRARTFQFSQMPRILVSALLLLPGLACVGGVAREAFSADGVPQEAWLAFLPGVTLLVFGAVVFGGVQRFANAIYRRHRFMRQEQSRRWRV